MQTGGTTYYYVTNLQGDVVALLDASGNAVASYAYDPYGKILTAEGTMAETNPLRYRGYYYDTETGLYYVFSRYYDSEIARWISPEPNVYTSNFDSIAGFLGYNTYIYCANNPVNASDDNGQWIHILVGGVVGGLTSYISSRLAGDSVEDALLSAAFGTASGALCAAFPGASVAIDAISTAAESITLGVKQGRSADEITTDVIVSTTFSLLTCGRGNTLAEKSTYEALKNAKKASKKAYRPALKKAAKEQMKKVRRGIAKKVSYEFGEYGVEKVMEYGTKWYVKRTMNVM